MVAVVAAGFGGVLIFVVALSARALLADPENPPWWFSSALAALGIVAALSVVPAAMDPLAESGALLVVAAASALAAAAEVLSRGRLDASGRWALRTLPGAVLLLHSDVALPPGLLGALLTPPAVAAVGYGLRRLDRVRHLTVWVAAAAFAGIAAAGTGGVRSGAVAVAVGLAAASRLRRARALDLFGPVAGAASATALVGLAGLGAGEGTAAEPVVLVPVLAAAWLLRRRRDGRRLRYREKARAQGVVLVGGQLAVAVAAGLADDPWTPLLAAGAVLVGVLAPLPLARHLAGERAVRRRRPLVLLAGATVGGVVVLGAAGIGGAVVHVRSAVRSGSDAVAAARTAAFDGRFDEAAGLLDAAGDDFEDARTTIRRLRATGVTLVPWVGEQVDAAELLTVTGRNLAASGADVTVLADGDVLQPVGGRLPVADIRALATASGLLAADVRAARADIAGMNRTGLVAPLADAAAELDERLAELDDVLTPADATLQALPALLGADGPRRYLLVAQNPAELRATGGFPGSWALVSADDGEVTVGQASRLAFLDGSGVVALPEELRERYDRFEIPITPQSLNVVLEPTDAADLFAMRTRPDGQDLDGVLFVDPHGLAAMLQLTGPVTVDGWPVPITAQNVLAVTMSEAYAAFDVKDDRFDFLGDVAAAVWAQLFTTGAVDPATAADVLAPAVAGRHLIVVPTDPAERAALDTAGLTGRHGEPDGRLADGDHLVVVNQNVGADKLDYHLRRQVEVDTVLEPVPDPDRQVRRVTVRTMVTVTLTNFAVPELPAYVAGEDATNHTYVSVYSPHELVSAAIDGVPAIIETERERSWRVHSAAISIPPGETRRVSVRVEGTVELTDDGAYQLHVGHQPLAEDGPIRVATEVGGSGWRLALPAGGAGRSVTEEVTLDRDRTFTARLVRADRSQTNPVAPSEPVAPDVQPIATDTTDTQPTRNDP